MLMLFLLMLESYGVICKSAWNVKLEPYGYGASLMA